MVHVPHKVTVVVHQEAWAGVTLPLAATTDLTAVHPKPVLGAVDLHKDPAILPVEASAEMGMLSSPSLMMICFCLLLYRHILILMFYTLTEIAVEVWREIVAVTMMVVAVVVDGLEVEVGEVEEETTSEAPSHVIWMLGICMELAHVLYINLIVLK